VDEMSLAVLTVISIGVVASLEVIGVNTTLLALAVGYIYGRSLDTVLMATVVSSCVTWGAVCLGCLVAYALGSTCLKEWSRELQRRNRLFAALDTVLEQKGLTVNLMLRLVLPDLIINFAMATSSCTFLNFVLGFSGLAPWIIVYCYYGASIESLTSLKNAGAGGDDEETIELVVGIVVTTVLAFVIAWYTKKALDDMVAEATNSESSSSDGSGALNGRQQGANPVVRSSAAAADLEMAHRPGRSRGTPRSFHQVRE
jgi:Uncharacterized conserved protein